MTADSQWPLQQAVFAALSGDAALQTLIGNPARVYDHVPQDSPFPYVVVGEATTRPFDTKTEDGMEQTLTIHSWSRYRGFSETKQIMGAIVDALDQQALSVTGWKTRSISVAHAPKEKGYAAQLRRNNPEMSSCPSTVPPNIETATS